MPALLIEDYALIGDLHTAALVSRDGSIDWLCWPNFASAACFASLIGTEDNGFWRLGPAGKTRSIKRRYQPHTLILETNYETEDGSVQVMDFMPLRNAHSHVVRVVSGVKGTVAMRSTLAIRFSYGEAVPWVRRTAHGIRAVAGPDAVEFQTDAPMLGENFKTISDFKVREGEKVSFVLSYGRYGDYRETSIGYSLNIESEYEKTQQFWNDWAAKGTYKGPYREMVERSLITLKALSFQPTGGIVAAPTTSLPEELGGTRNWDYRYCWLRDTTFTLLALMNGGYYDEALEWMRWLHRTIAGKPDQVQIMYGIAGERRLPEWEINSLSGYENSRPVRIGNAAAAQLQLDTYGEVLDAFFWSYSSLKEDSRAADYALLREVVEHLETIWEQPDNGIWEVRGGPQHFTYSKVMAWVAFDRAIKIAEKSALEAPVERWTRVRDTIHDQVCKKAFNQKLNSFVQSYGSDELDASVLLMPMVGFLSAEDPRIRGTVAAIEKHLMRDGLVMRYDTSKAKDGLPGSEGSFLACSFWMVSNLKMVGREEDAHRLFERLLSLANDTGLLAEEYDSKRKRQVGNYPQAFSHIALIGAAFHLAEKGERRHEMSKGADD
ncbi:MAG TPA: glycoside hydrolase family 15 protein [Terracidiphilus sp.]|nr:glycoside hydrolase family 15 protein [Terracidiphilus sp.]